MQIAVVRNRLVGTEVCSAWILPISTQRPIVQRPMALIEYGYPLYYGCLRQIIVIILLTVLRSRNNGIGKAELRNSG